MADAADAAVAAAPEEVRADGGIGSLWATAGGPSMEIVEIDYAEVLREKQGDEALADRLVAAALSGAELELDESGMRTAARDRRRSGAADGADAAAREAHRRTRPARSASARSSTSLRGLAEYVGKTNPAQLDQTLRQIGQVAGRLSAEAMLELLVRRAKPEAMAGNVDVVSAMVHRMSDSARRRVRLELGHHRARPDRSAGAGVPGPRARTPTGSGSCSRSPQPDVAASELGQEAAFEELWQKVEAMLTSYSDEKFVSDAYARELSGARARAVDVEAASDDPPERIAGWLATVADASLRNARHAAARRPASASRRTRRAGATSPRPSIAHAEDLVRVGYFDQALQLAEAVTTEGDARRGAHGAARATCSSGSDAAR